jgi:hypothetical protein
VRARHADYTPATETTVHLDLFAAEPSAAAKPLRSLSVTTNKEGEANLELNGLTPAAYRLAGRATVDGRPLTDEQTFVVRPEGRELEDVVSREGVLREIARTSGGQFTVGELGSPAVRKAREVRVGALRTIELWSSPLLLLIAVLLLGTEWALRRRAGHG